MGFQLRPLKDGDQASWRAAWEAFRTGLDDKPRPAEVVETAWRRFLDPDVPMHVIGAFDDSGKLIGFVHYLFHYSAGSIEQLCYLQTLYAAPEARGQGVGRALIEAVYAAAREAGSPRVYWQMSADNADARPLYEKIAERTDFIQYRKML